VVSATCGVEFIDEAGAALTELPRGPVSDGTSDTNFVAACGALA
jgi:hypothetical protein